MPFVEDTAITTAKVYATSIVIFAIRQHPPHHRSSSKYASYIVKRPGHGWEGRGGGLEAVGVAQRCTDAVRQAQRQLDSAGGVAGSVCRRGRVGPQWGVLRWPSQASSDVVDVARQAPLETPGETWRTKVCVL